MGVKAPGTAKRMVFLEEVRSEIVTVSTSLVGERKERVASGSLEPTEMEAWIFGVVVVVEKWRGFLGEEESLREKVDGARHGGG